VALVPTMGYLHDGHMALVHEARQEADVVVASVFVNPMQFAAHEDLGTYPQDTARDLQLLEQAGVHAVLLPSKDDLYGAGHTMMIDPGPEFASLAEGKARGPHFFRGVATVVSKLFNIVQPSRAYFGQKDAMQCVLIRKLVRELNFATEVVVVPTIREADGLAMSSRNVVRWRAVPSCPAYPTTDRVPSCCAVSGRGAAGSGALPLSCTGGSGRCSLGCTTLRGAASRRRSAAAGSRGCTAH
jgi:pantoate--beta-alanine ligase